jgi:hypothetical protein
MRETVLENLKSLDEISKMRKGTDSIDEFIKEAIQYLNQ